MSSTTAVSTSSRPFFFKGTVLIEEERQDVRFVAVVRTRVGRKAYHQDQKEQPFLYTPKHMGDNCVAKMNWNTRPTI